MAPKKKNNKKGGASWEDELGEIIPSADTQTAPPPANGEAGENKDENDDQPSSGLMNLMRKRKQRREAKGLAPEEDEAEAEAETTEATQDSGIKAPTEANAEDEFAPVDNKKGKGAQNNKGKKGGANAAAAADDGDGGSGRILTKAEKEKAKKEKEKQRKKEQALLKKKTGPADKPEEAAKSKAEPEKKADAPAEAISASEAAASETGGKKKKLPAHLAALQKQQALLKEQQAALEQAEADAAREAKEREEQDAAENKAKEEKRMLKKQKEKEKIEQLKKSGEYMTAAQKKEQARNREKLEQMKAAGIQIGPSDDNDNDARKSKAASEKAERARRAAAKKDKIDEDKLLQEAAERARLQVIKDREEKEAREKAEAEAKKAKAAEAAAEEIDDDWEAAADSDAPKESWDDDESSDEDGKDKTVKEAEKEVKKDESSDDSEDEATRKRKNELEVQRKREAAERREKAHQAALAARSKDNLRSPICCILGHVDTGKTKLLDKIRQTNVQEGEAGGITQQIGATYFPVEAIKQKTAVVNPDGAFEFKVPGLLVIDTPGHESFSNLRSRGSSLCNIAILVVDIMHGLEKQTLESMRMLRDRKTPFIVALNKIDRLFGWKKVDNNGFQESLALQNKGVQNEFKSRLESTKLAFAEQGFNAELFYENKSMSKFVSLVPTSAHTGEGVPDMLKLIVQLTQERMVGSLMYLSEVQATVLEVKNIEGLGMTIDVVLSNGILREGDRIVVCGSDGAIVTNIRALLTPQPMRELRLKSAYVHHKEVKAALGVKISAPNLEGVIAGSRLLVVGEDDDEDDLADEVEADLQTLFNRVAKSGKGVSVQASTLGSLEALLDFLKDCKIPVANVGIGPLYKRDVMQCGTMLEKAPDYAVILAFDVKIDKDAQSYADETGIKIFHADIIYHLFDFFTKHMADLLEKKKEDSKMLAVFPCVLNTVAVFNKCNPIVVGVDVIDGSLRINTPIAAVKANPTTGQKEIVPLGRVTSIERDHKQVPVCKKGQPSVAVKIEMGGNQPTYGRQLEEADRLFSQISRASIECLKEFYRGDMTQADWQLLIKLKPAFDIS